MSPSWRTTRAVAASLGAALIAGLGSAITYYVVRNRTYWIHDRRAASAAGFIERTAWVDGAALHYAEGPDNGPPLLLIHGQMVDWRSEEHTSELQSRGHLVCRLLLEKKKQITPSNS